MTTAYAVVRADRLFVSCGSRQDIASAARPFGAMSQRWTRAIEGEAGADLIVTAALLGIQEFV